MSLFNGEFDNNDFLPELNGQETETVTEDTETLETSPEEGQDDIQEESDETEDQASEEEQQGNGLLAGKFKSPEELEKGYKNLETYLGKLTQQVSDLRKQGTKQEGEQPPLYPQMPQAGYGTTPQQPDVASQIADRIANNLTGMYGELYSQVEATQDFMRNMADRDTLRTLSTQDPENFKDVAPLLVDTLNTHPELRDLPNGIELAYKLSRDAIMQTKIKEKVSQARKEAYQSKEVKILSNTGTSKAGSQAPQKSDAEKIIDSMFDIGPGKLKI